MRVYAVRLGRNPGIYYSWNECRSQTDGFPRADFKSFNTEQEARAYLNPFEALVEQKREQTKLVIFTDGSFAGNKAGYGVVFPDGREFFGVAPIVEASNQSAELYAIYFALYRIAQEKERNYLIFSDSEYSINACTVWISNWRKNGWMTSEGTPVKHRILIAAAADLIEKTGTVLQWIKGHANNPGNCRADKLARMAVGLV